jgi:hypothetical protein
MGILAPKLRLAIGPIRKQTHSGGLAPKEDGRDAILQASGQRGGSAGISDRTGDRHANDERS